MKKRLVMIFRVQLILALLVVILAGYSSKAQVPGFQGTVNNYGVGMNPEDECRHPETGKPQACSQWFRFRFQADNDGIVHAPFTITNDSLRGYCGRVKIVVRDRANTPGNVLLTVLSPRYCIQGKGSGTDYHERRADVDWTFKADSAVGRNGADLYMVPVEYQDIGLNWGDILPTAIDIVGAAVKVAEAVFL